MEFCGSWDRAQWRELPKKYPLYQTCHRRFRQWVREDELERILRVQARELQARGKLQLEEAFIHSPLREQKRGPRSRAHQARQRSENHRSRRVSDSTQDAKVDIRDNHTPYV